MLRLLRQYTLLAALIALLSLAFLGYAFLSGTQPAPPEERPAVWEETGPWAEDQLASLSLEEKVEQLLLLAADDPSDSALHERVRRGVAGVFFRDPSVSASLLDSLQQQARLPLLISQGLQWGHGPAAGAVPRLPHPLVLGATENPDFARAAGYTSAQVARTQGIHFVEAPLVSGPHPDSLPGSLPSFSEQPHHAARMVTASVQGLQDGGTLALARYTPPAETEGALAAAATRLGVRSAAQVPAALRNALDAGLMSVVLPVPETDRAETDASRAPPQEDLAPLPLRDELRYQGLLIADASTRPTPKAVVHAVRAGADLVIVPAELDGVRDALLRAVDENRLSEELLDAAVYRILRAKEWLGLPDDQAASPRSKQPLRDHHTTGTLIAEKGLTLLRNQSDLLPLLEPGRVLLSLTLSDTPGATTNTTFNRALIETVADSLLTTQVIGPDSSPEDLDTLSAAADTADLTLVALHHRDEQLPDRVREALDRLDYGGTPVVLVSFGPPQAIATLTGQPNALVAAYDGIPALQEAAVAALFGRIGFSGRLPVPVPGRYETGSGLDLAPQAPGQRLPEAVGMRFDYLARTDSLLQNSIREGAFPGAALAVGRGPAVVKLDGYGTFTYEATQRVHPHSLFDLASLTKPIATTTAVMKLYEQGRIELDATVASYLPAFGQSGKDGVTIWHLLTHTSGLPAFHPFHTMGFTSRHEVIEAIMQEELEYEPGTQTVYSDLGLITLALVIEQITGRNFADYTREAIFEPLRMHRTGFRPVDTGSDASVVPTEVDRTFRGRLMQGEVHDETAYLLGGAAGHAGLFSTAEDLSAFGYMLVNEGRIYGEQFLEPETIELFTRRAGLEGSTRALGWDTKSDEGYSSAGRHFGPNSFGHTGFTGTSFWVDPDEKLYVILLTNRVHPTRENRQIVQVRPRLANLVHTSLVGPIAPVLPGDR